MGFVEGAGDGVGGGAGERGGAGFLLEGFGVGTGRQPPGAVCGGAGEVEHAGRRQRQFAAAARPTPAIRTACTPGAVEGGGAGSAAGPGLADREIGAGAGREEPDQHHGSSAA
ncbi:hypothetical protein [Streptomyces sp. 147326]|uniref:hypothetical protein n=1 Tax=Streptomyces sp. 147326 TaxID=3074379 RepID=UPI003857576C